MTKKEIDEMLERDGDEFLTAGFEFAGMTRGDAQGKVEAMTEEEKCSMLEKFVLILRS